MTQNISDLTKKQRAIEVNRVALEMKRYLGGDAGDIQHFVRVYTLARSIGELERLGDDEQECVELASIVHGVSGSDPAAEARELLRACSVEEEVIMQVCHIVENKDNLEHISSLDHQIFVEARMIVQFKEQNTPADVIVSQAEKHFITNSGKLFLKRAFDV
jgi:hypothetical protein